MTTRTVISASNVPSQSTAQRGISIIIDQDQAEALAHAQKPPHSKDIQLDTTTNWQKMNQKQQQQQQQQQEQEDQLSLQPELNLITNNNIELNDVELVSIQHEMSTKYPTQTKTFIDINRNDIQLSDHHHHPHNHHHNHQRHYSRIDNSSNGINELKETGYSTISTFLHIDQKESTKAFGERGKLIGEKAKMIKTTDDSSYDNYDDKNTNNNDVDGSILGKTTTQMQKIVVAPIVHTIVNGVSETNTEYTSSQSSNGKTKRRNDVQQNKAMKALDGGGSIKKTIIQCNVENHDDDYDNDDRGYFYNDWNNKESSVHIGGCGGSNAVDANANTDANDDVDGQVLCNGLRIVDGNGNSKLHDASIASSKISCLTKADCARSAAAKQTFDNSANNDALHVVKIQINQNKNQNQNQNQNQSKSDTIVKENKKVTVVQVVNEKVTEEKINIKKQIIEAEEMVQKPPTSTSIASATPEQNDNNSITSGNTTVTELNVTNPSFLYFSMSSGQFSPCDTLDSGTGSDLESNSTSGRVPNAIRQTGGGGGGAPKLEMHLKTTKIRVNNGSSNKQQNGEHQRAGSLTDSEESESSSLSCDSLHSTEYVRQSPPTKLSLESGKPSKTLNPFLPDSLLRDIRDRKFPTNDFDIKYGNRQSTNGMIDDHDHDSSMSVINAQKLADEVAEHAKFLQECNARDNEEAAANNDAKRASLPPNKTFILDSENGTFVDTKMNSMPRKYEADKYYNFHVNEHANFRSFRTGNGSTIGGSSPHDHRDETSLMEEYGDTKNGSSIHNDDFAGYKDIRCNSGTSTIRSSKGTVRGVKNRVRNGIATFLQMQQPHVKNYMEKDIGKVVLYTTSMGIIRDTYAKCSNVKQILRTLLVKFEERDVFMSLEYQAEIKNRMNSDIIRVPQLFVEGQHIGDAETVERLNESGELRQLLKPYKSISTAYTCQTCGGYRLLPCPSCNGSKKSVHRNHFTAEFVALKCMNCDEVGLVKCHNC